MLPVHDGEDHDRECERCREALGMRRRHEKGKPASTNSMSADVRGPRPEAVGSTFKYMLVGPGPKQLNLPFAMGNSTKSANEVNDDINAALAELHTMLGEQVVVRLHSADGKEFANKASNEHDLGTLRTTPPQRVGMARGQMGELSGL